METKQIIGIFLFTIFLLCSGFYIGWEYHDDNTVGLCNKHYISLMKEMNCYDNKEDTIGSIPDFTGYTPGNNRSRAS